MFSIDYSNSLDIIVTGSADSTVKVWRLSTGAMLKTLTQYRSAWIMQVCLYDWCCACADSDDTECNHCKTGSTDTKTPCDGSCVHNESTRGRHNEQDGLNAGARARAKKCCILSRDNVSLHLWCLDVSGFNVSVSASVLSNCW